MQLTKMRAKCDKHVHVKHECCLCRGNDICSQVFFGSLLCKQTIERITFHNLRGLKIAFN